MSSYEEYILKILKKENVAFVMEKTFKDLRKGRYRYDFYLPDLNILIEVDGEFHFSSPFSSKKLKKAKENDRRKNRYALIRSIPLYRIPHWELKNIKTLEDIFQEKFLVKDIWHNDELI